VKQHHWRYHGAKPARAHALAGAIAGSALNGGDAIWI
jgi:hypothetical protein